MKKNCNSNLACFGIGKSKLFRVMKIITVLLFVCSITQAMNVIGQKVNISVQNGVVLDVIEEIEKQCDFRFAYSPRFVDMDKAISIEVSETEVTQVLDQVLKGTNLTYVIDGDVVVLRPAGMDSVKDQLDVQQGAQQGAQQETKTITGVVTDDINMSLPGVTVYVKGTSSGTTTDIDGKYTISDVKTGDVLVFSFVGMTTQRVEVGAKVSIDMVMKTDAIGLNEVVAVGYATQKKVNLTGSVAQVKTEDLENAAVTTTSSALQGLGAGLTISQNSGMAGEDGSTIKIRGIGTLNAGQDPLVLVDGIVMSMDNVDANDIESVSILKDAASAAIYGSRAANGVILITTKGGKRDMPTKVKYNTYYSISEVTNVPDMLNAYEHALLSNEAQENDGLAGTFSDEDLEGLKNALRVTDLDFPNNLSADERARWEENPNYQDVDYAGMNFESAIVKKHHLSVEGGGKNSSGRMSFGYIDQEGIRVGNKSESYNLKLNFESSLNERIKIYSSLYFFNKEYDLGASSSGGNWTVAPWNGLAFPNGLYGGEADFVDLELGASRKTTNNRLIGLIGTKINLASKLDLVLEYSKVLGFTKYENFTPSRFDYNGWDDLIGEQQSSIEKESYESERQTGTATLNYKLKLNEKSKFNFLVGSSFEDYIKEGFEASRTDLLNNSQPVLTQGDANSQLNDDYATEYGVISFFGRANYNYDDRYLFEVNVRADGSSRFSEDNYWGTFPSASMAWRVSEEDFLKDVSAIDNLKLRLSYGELGNSNVSNYAARSVLSTGSSYPVNNELSTTVKVSSLANEDIKWETTTMSNIGIDMNLLESLSLSFDYYNKTSKDVLYRVSVPGTTGVSSGPYENIAEVENIGWDLSLGWNKKFDNDLRFGVNLMLSSYKNKINKLKGDGEPTFLDDAYDSKTDQPMYVWQEGEAVNSFFGYTSGGVASQELLDSGVLADHGYDLTAGDLWYKDINEDGEINDEDRGIIGSPHPDLIYSLNLSAKWKGFDVSLLLEGAYGADALLFSPMYRTEFKSANVNKVDDILDRWTPDNIDAKYPKLSSLEDKTKVSDFYMEDASYLRGKDLTFGYTLSKSTLKKIGLQHARVYTNFRNLFVLTDFRGLDPETYDMSDTSRTGGVPPSKTYTLGLQVTF